MSNNVEFISGLIVKAPNDGAPEYVKCKVSIKREELIAWLQTREGKWVNADIKVGQSGKYYAQVDNWNPEGKREPQRKQQPQRQSVPFDDDLPDF